MKKIIVIGCPGSGKSYFSKKLSEITNIPKFHLDVLFWQENWVKTPRDEFLNKILDVINNNSSWIIDGNYQSTLEFRIQYADTIFFLDMPTKLCLESERLRRGKPRDDLPSYLIEEGEDEEFVNLITNFQDNQRHLIVEILEKHKDKNIIVFKSREEVNQYLLKLESENVS
jgi:adenylate kinase family enzyme